MSNPNRITCNPEGLLGEMNIGTGTMTFAVKDTIDIAGFPTQAGCKFYESAPPAKEHASIVSSLLASGFRCIGKTALHELAFGVTGINQWSGTPLNYRYPNIIPGGSSSGSATAVASGTVDFAVGTDTGGSVRMPATCCGIIGMKPTWGLISRKGVLPNTSSLDCVGFFTRNLDVMEEIFNRLNIIDGITSKNILIPALIKGEAIPAIDILVENWIKSKNQKFAITTLPSLSMAHKAGISIINYENWQAFSFLAKKTEISQDIRTRLLAGEVISDDEIDTCEKFREVFTKNIDEILSIHGFIMLPSLPELPPTLEEASDPLKIVNLTCLLRPFNLSGHPSITIPIGEINQRPVSIQIIGKKSQDKELINFAKKLNNK